MSAEQTGSDRRQFGRRRSCIHAFALVPGRAAIPCVVQNYSAEGAMLELSELVVPPFKFAIRIGLEGREISCEVRHQRGERIGVKFLGAGVDDVLQGALGGVVRPLKARRTEAAADAEAEIVAAPARPRVTGSDLRRIVFKRA